MYTIALKAKPVTCDTCFFNIIEKSIMCVCVCVNTTKKTPSLFSIIKFYNNILSWKIIYSKKKNTLTILYLLNY